MADDKLATTLDPYQPASFDDAWRLAKIIVDSRLALGVDTAAQAFLILATGAELGLSAMQSLRGIHNIHGRPCPSADTLVAVVLASGKAEYFREISNDGNVSVWETKRVGDTPRRYSFSITSARTAGLVNAKNINWQKYPQRMLAARAKSYLARDVYPDLVLGLYTPEEIMGTDDPLPMPASPRPPSRDPLPAPREPEREREREPERESGREPGDDTDIIEAEIIEENEQKTGLLDKLERDNIKCLVAELGACASQSDIDALLPRLKAARAAHGPNSDELVIAWKQAKARIQGK